MSEVPTATVTRLLTLLNSTTTLARPGKRKRDDFTPAEKKLNKRHITFHEDILKGPEIEPDAPPVEEEVNEPDEPDNADPYEAHFGMHPVVLTESARNAVDKKDWITSRSQNNKLGLLSVSVPSGSVVPDLSTSKATVLDRLAAPLLAEQAKQKKDVVELQRSVLSTLGTRADLYHPIASWESHSLLREATALHVLDHVTRKRRRVLKNNERVANAAKADGTTLPPENIQDQGFTRPSVLILLPFRSSALAWFNALCTHTPSPQYQIENQSRFLSEYGLPSGTVDKLASAEPGTYPLDHVETFRGNVDDNFRLGVKMTRKSMKLFSEFYGCDIIMASPLGLRMTIEKDKNADFLSSIEILVVDQLDALTMQNWEHVQFVFSHLNKLPKESHDTDFSRIKPWYLDNHALYLRQTILFSAYETPETRALFNQLSNVAGKIRSEKRYQPVQVPEGIDQSFLPFDCANPKDELEKRYQYFTTQVLPGVLKSAVQSANTVIFIPSSFDFIRIQNYFKKLSGVSFTILSEYSTNQDISRARQAFFGGKKAFLLITERFHFFRRYKIRGIRNLIFYGPPDHPQFYTELLSYPFLDDGVEPSDVTCKLIFSKYDWFRMERITGTEEANNLIGNLRETRGL